MKSSSLIKYFLFAILVIQSESSQKWLSQVSGFNKNDANNGYAVVMGSSILGLRVSGGKQYRAHVKGGNWLPAVTGINQNDEDNGYAGNGRPIDPIAVSNGNLFAIHVQGGSWLSPVSGYNINDGINGYAGIMGKTIDAVMIRFLYLFKGKLLVAL